MPDLVSLCAALPALPLSMTALNALTWSRCPPGERLRGVSALVPMRDEATNVDGCVATILAAGVDELIVYDDASTDDTPALLAAWAARDRRVRVLRGNGPAPGWRGKPHACQRLAEAARFPHLLFLDADVRLEPDALARLGPALQGVDALSAMPRQETGSPVEHLILPMLTLTATSWLPLAILRWLPFSSMAVANGQLWLFKRAAWDAVGGYRRVRDEVAEDLALARLMKRSRRPMRFVDGHHLASCRMYRDGPAVLDGFSKNLYPAMGGHLPILAMTLTVYVATLLAPWVLLPFAPGLATIGVALNLAQRALLAARHGHHPLAVLAHPLAVLAFVGIALRSAWWRWTGAGSWRGRALWEAA